MDKKSEGQTEGMITITPQFKKHIVEVLKNSTAQIDRISADNRYMSARLGVFDNMMAIFNAGGGRNGCSVSNGDSTAWQAKHLIEELEAAPKDESELQIMENIKILQGEVDVINKRMHVLMEELRK